MIPGYRRITGAVHAHGVPILAQLNHNGGQSSGMYTRLPVLAPSPVPDPLFREVPKPVEPLEIAEIVDGYARVARHCAAGRVRRGGAAGLTVLDHPGVPVPGHQPADRRVRRAAAQPGPAAAGDRGRGARGDRTRPGPRRADLRRRADRGRHHPQRGGRGGAAGQRHRSRRLHQHHARGGHGHPVHGRGQHAHRPGLRHARPGRDPRRGGYPGDRGGPDHRPAAGRPGAGRRSVRPGRRGPRADRRPRLHGPGPGRADGRDPHLPVLQPGVRGPGGAQSLARLHRQPAGRAGIRATAPRARRRGAGCTWSAAAPAGFRPR